MKKLFIIISILINVPFVFAATYDIGNWVYLEDRYNNALANDILHIVDDIIFNGAITSINYREIIMRGWDNTANAAHLRKLNGSDLYPGFTARDKIMTVEHLSFSNFFESRAYYLYGGAFYIVQNSSITFKGAIEFMSNNAPNGGALGLETQSQVFFNGNDIKFRNNIARESGGAIFMVDRSRVIFNSATEFTNNSAAINGGALSLQERSWAIFDGSSIKFENNTAQKYGGAIYMLGDTTSAKSTVTINALNGNVLFDNNEAGEILGQRQANDIYLDAHTVLELNAAAGKIIEMRGGILSANTGDIFIKKTGVGKLIFGENAIVNFKGDFNIEGGTVIFNNGYGAAVNFSGNIRGAAGTFIEKNGAGDFVFGGGAVINYNGGVNINGGAVYSSGVAAPINFKILNIKSDGKYSTIGGGIMQNTIIGSGIISGTLDIEVDFAFQTADKITVNGTKLAIKPNSLNMLFSGDNPAYIGNTAVIFDTSGSAEIDFQKNFSAYGTQTYTFIYNPAARQEVKVIYGGTAWNTLAFGYRTTYQDISLIANITALSDDIDFGDTLKDFTIDGQNHYLDAAHKPTALGFALTNSRQITFKDLSFKNFDGSAITIDNSQIKIQAENGNILFEGNAADISLSNASTIELNAASGKTIAMKSKILGVGGEITKTGNGDLIFDSAAAIDYRGKFNIINGIVKAPISISSISVLTIGAGTKLSLVDSAFSQHLLFVGGAAISGIFDIGLDLSAISSYSVVNNAADMLISTGTITINSGSRLNVNPFNSFKFTGAVAIMQTGGLNSDWADNLSYNTINYQIYEDNNYLILRLLRDPKDPVNQGADKFLAHSLSLSAQSRGLDDIYNRIDRQIANRKDGEDIMSQKGNAWVGLYGSGKSADDFSVNGFGVTAGADLYKNQNLMGGLFVRYGSNDIKENDNKGTMGETEFGIYGGYGGLFEIKNKPINLKANLSMGIQSYSMEIGETIDFGGKAIKSGVEFEYISALSHAINIKPFIGFQSALVMNDEIKTYPFSISENSFMRLESKIGLSLDGKLSENENFHWYSRLYAILLIAGDGITYKVKNTNGGENEIQSIKEGALNGAISFGGDYSINESVSTFINAGVQFGEGFGWSIGIGANYKF